MHKKAICLPRKSESGSQDHLVGFSCRRRAGKAAEGLVTNKGSGQAGVKEVVLARVLQGKVVWGILVHLK